jgi:hypothetical protein
VNQLPGWARRSLSLLALFVCAKLLVLGGRVADGLGAPLASGWTLAGCFDQDVWVVLAWAASDFAISRVARRGAWGWSLYTLVAGYVAFNVPATRVFSSPLTWPILSATGAALSDSIKIYLTARNLLPMIAIGAIAAIVPRLFRRRPGRRALAALAVAALLAIGLGPIARRHVELYGLHRNALFTLAATALAERAAPGAAPAIAPLVAEGPAIDLGRLRGAARGKNLVWVGLESTAAQYLAPYGAARDPMPRLSKLAARGAVFESVYAVYPESIKGLFSMLCSTAPAAHTAAARYTAQALPCPSVASELRQAGYHTALFHSGRFVYLGMRGVVEARGFDVLADAGDIGGRYASSFGVDEPSTVQRILAWIDALPRGEPFFVLYLPIAGHHPYNAPGDGPRPFGAASELDAYASDLYRGDLALGALEDGLAARGLGDDTVWLLAGDHGEAFQQHPGNFAHTLFLYEENVHVPFVVVAPGQPPARAPQVGSLLDLAPTLLALAGRAAPAAWQGRSLLDPTPGIARFYTDQALWQVGLRDGDWKLIHELETGHSQLFDLRHDPGEKNDLAATDPARVARYRAHLAGWSAAERALVLGYPR